MRSRPGVDAEADVGPWAAGPDAGRLRGCPAGTERAEVVEVGEAKRPTDAQVEGAAVVVRSLAPTKETFCMREGCVLRPTGRA